jgi:hypothetical protein
MATYKVWLTVKDSYGKTKELDGGVIDVDLKQVTEDVIDKIEDTLDEIVPDVKPAVYVPNVTPNNILEFNLQDEATDKHLEFDIDKTNDWNAIEHTSGSNYVWERMQ